MRKRSHVALTSILLGASLGAWAGCSDRIVDPLAPPPASGAVSIHTTTVGRLPDPDGYGLSVDGAEKAWIGPDDSVTIRGFEPGEHEVALTDVSAGCAVEGSNPRLVTVGSGITSTSFRVDCTGPPGPPITLSAVSGVNHVGRPGEPLPDPLVVQVTDSAGGGIAAVQVAWVITRGDGTLGSSFAPGKEPVQETSAFTDTAGLARIPVMPLAFDTLEVGAWVDGADGSPATFRIDATDPEATLAIVSGNEQPAKAGRRLDGPLVVRVADGRGEPVPHIVVAWNVDSGDGDLGQDGAGSRLHEAIARTDVDGLSHVSLTPTWFGRVEVSASAAGVDGPRLIFTADATDPGAGLSIVSGGGQVGKTAEPLAMPFLVRATDGLGNPAANVRVLWSVVQGSGGFGRYADWWESGDWEAWPSSERSAYTDEQGLARATFSPFSLGTVGVDARLDGTGSTATFTAAAESLVIHYGSVPWVGILLDDVACARWAGTEWAISSCEESAVPLGTKVEWVNHLAQAQIVSTSRPPDGPSFDSGLLMREERFEFTAEVMGTWEYVDQVRGVRSRLRVY